MENQFSGSEITEIGIQIERNGYAFYTRAAAAATSGKVKNIFEFLAVEEQRHISVFSKLLGEIQDYEPVASFPEEYFLYLKALGNEHVFTRDKAGEEAAARAGSDLEALDMALGFEKDSILLFTEYRNIVMGEGKKIVEELIKQEQEHFRQLFNLKAALK